MSSFSPGCIPRAFFACALLGLILAACEDSTTSDVKVLALHWVDRQFDSLSDSGASLLPDSVWIDSLAVTWTSDEWLRFWEEVEREQIRRREVDTTRHGS